MNCALVSVNVGESTSPLSWPEKFFEEHGRPPRVLHIGNIANNAYLNAKFLRASGIEADVLCYDYYHVMGCPEWEDADFDAQHLDQHHPDWRTVDLAAPFARPEWFVQGPMHLAVEYLLANLEGDRSKANSLRREMQSFNFSKLEKSCSSATENRTTKLSAPTSSLEPVRVAEGGEFNSLVLAEERGALEIIRAKIRRRVLSIPLRHLLCHFPQHYRAQLGNSRFAFPVNALSAAFTMTLSVFVAGVRAFRRRIVSGRFTGKLARIFHWSSGDIVARSRARASLDVLTARGVISGKDLKMKDIEPFFGLFAIQFKQLLTKYDVVHAYATDGILPLLFDCPYVAYEHGTIRNIPFEDTPQGRRCAAAYRGADAVVITNADNIVAAERLGLKHHEFVPHPVNDWAIRDIRERADDLHRELHAELGAEFVVFHPARQHWEERRHPDWEKGNDYFIRGFARFVHECCPTAKALFIEWGASVEDSRRLIESLGIVGNVVWFAPVPHLRMVELILGSDALADQFYLGAFGSTMPKALACGRPALLYLNEELHRWCFPEMPPVANVRTESEIFGALKRLYSDSDYYSALAKRGAEWYQRWHSSELIVDRLQNIYAGVIERRKVSTGDD